MLSSLRTPLAAPLAVSLAVSAAAALALAGTGALLPQAAQAQQPGKPQELLLVSYAVTKAAYDRILPRFVADYRKQTGQSVVVKASYGGSGSQARAVIDGLEADVVGLALAGDILRIQEAGLIAPGWEKENPNHSIITNSVVALFVRPGNPKRISQWSDLDNKNVEVITANPRTSGGARWNFLALWGSVSETGGAEGGAKGGSEARARSFITSVYRNVDTLPKDAREATDVFVKRGQGDVLLNYENEAILARKSGAWTTPTIVPKTNVLIEAPIAVVDRNVDRKGTRKVAEAFARYLYSDTAQRIFAAEGFRPVTARVKAETRKEFPVVSKIFTANDFGGWSSINKKYFGKGGLWDQIFSQSR